MPKIEFQKGAKNLVRLLTSDPLPEEGPAPVPGEPPVEEDNCWRYADASFIWPTLAFAIAPLITFILVIYRVVKGYESPNASMDRIIFGSIIGAFLVFPYMADLIFEHVSWLWTEWTTRIHKIACDLGKSSSPDVIVTLVRLANVVLAAMMIFVYIKWFKSIMDMDPFMFMGAIALLYGLGPAGIVILAFVDFSRAPGSGKGKKRVKSKAKSKSK